jgi:SpoVK/Ycf46/Vps4 family AAA+-type ATPase
MAKQQPVKLEYYEAAAYGPHIFFTRALEFLVQKINVKGAKIGYHAFLDRPLDDIEVFGADAGAEEIVTLLEALPLGGLNFIKNTVSGRRVALREPRRDLFLRFEGVTKHPVYIGRLTLLTPEYHHPGSLTCMFIVAYSGEEAGAFLSEYYDSIRNRNRNLSCILNPMGEPVVDFREMKWDNVFLPKDMLDGIKQEAETFFQSKAMYEEHGLDWRRGILLAGPPGNGKTTICRALASNSSVPVVYCGMQDGDMFGLLSHAQATITQNAPCVAIFEDTDAFGIDPVIRSTFLNMLDGMYTCEGVLTIATTNSPDSLDSAFTGRPSRFDSYYLVSNPGPQEREKMLMFKLGKKGKNLSKNEVAQLVKDTDGLSAACVQEVASCSLLSCLKTKKPICMQILKDSVRKVKQHMKASKDGAERWNQRQMGFSPKFP